MSLNPCGSSADKSCVKIIVDLPGQDRLETDSEDSTQLKVIGCHAILSLVRSLIAAHGKDLKNWPLPEGKDHSAILVRELLLKQRGQWQYPYAHDEICHCRSVLTAKVDQAIVSGALTPAQVSRRTSASTACGTCRPDVEKILAYRLKTTA